MKRFHKIAAALKKQKTENLQRGFLRSLKRPKLNLNNLKEDRNAITPRGNQFASLY